MHAQVTFDTLEYMDELKRAGMKSEEAEAITKATAKAFTQMLETKELATKKDLSELKNDLQKTITETMWKTIGILVTFHTLVLGVFGIINYIK